MESQKINPTEKRSLGRRAFLFKAALSVPFFSLAYRLWDLQIINGDKYSKLAAGNSIRLKLIPAPRGIIYDRNFEVLATNIPSYNLFLTKEDCPDPNFTIKKLSYKLGVDLEKMMRSYNNKKKTAKFISFNIAEDITWGQMAYFLTFQNEFQGISMDYISKRHYPKGNNLAHVLGYMGGIDDVDLRKIPKKKRRSAKILGKSGIEKIYNHRLIGDDGGVQIEVDNRGRTIRELNSRKSKPGDTVLLTIDQQLQSEIEKRFGKRVGSIVVTNVKTNEILSMVSKPTFDPNQFSLGISPVEWTELIGDESKPLMNKSVQGFYSPGSTFKMLIAYAGLDLGIINQSSTFHCPGHYRNYGQTFRCWKSSGHGTMNVVSALEQSCNVFFYNLGNEIGIDNIHEYATKFGLGEKTGVNLLNELSGVIPSKEWKKKVYDRPWFPGETISVSIGQGYVTVTPLQLLNYMNVFINGGKKMSPLLVKKINPGNRTNTDTADHKKDPVTTSELLNLSTEYVSLIKRGMFNVVNGAQGTARSVSSRIVPISGKTGTTQIIGNKTREKLLAAKKTIDPKYDDHAWFVGFAPYEKPEISIVVMIENGKSGRNAALLGKEIIEYYFSAVSPKKAV